ncbi:hypothetical protein EVAR_59741_1 [Eumeta japonica]|uniref:Uncharacterized protein n=1 Tax=Eumeta variegata TaxID=151549 RepID=A0A4C1YZU0_EUMVA|nr:hypothetical protein EVAR_59741_1 [Eumeta japonica]
MKNGEAAVALGSTFEQRARVFFQRPDSPDGSIDLVESGRACDGKVRVRSLQDLLGNYQEGVDLVINPNSNFDVASDIDPGHDLGSHAVTTIDIDLDSI